MSQESKLLFLTGPCPPSTVWWTHGRWRKKHDFRKRIPRNCKALEAREHSPTCWRCCYSLVPGTVETSPPCSRGHFVMFLQGGVKQLWISRCGGGVFDIDTPSFVTTRSKVWIVGSVGPLELIKCWVVFCKGKVLYLSTKSGSKQTSTNHLAKLSDHSRTFFGFHLQYKVHMSRIKPLANDRKDTQKQMVKVPQHNATYHVYSISTYLSFYSPFKPQKKQPVYFPWNTGCLVGILTTVYYSPYI